MERTAKAALLQFSCSNHKSIKNKVMLSLVAGSKSEFSLQTWGFDGMDVLPSTIITGPNGSGKSTVIEALDYVKYLVKWSAYFTQEQGLQQLPFKSSPESLASEYEIHFIKDGIKYVYGFSIMQSTVSEEYLYYCNDASPIRIFERIGSKSNISFSHTSIS